MDSGKALYKYDILKHLFWTRALVHCTFLGGFKPPISQNCERQFKHRSLKVTNVKTCSARQFFIYSLSGNCKYLYPSRNNEMNRENVLALLFTIYVFVFERIKAKKHINWCTKNSVKIRVRGETSNIKKIVSRKLTKTCAKAVWFSREGTRCERSNIVVTSKYDKICKSFPLIFVRYLLIL